MEGLLKDPKDFAITDKILQYLSPTDLTHFIEAHASCRKLVLHFFVNLVRKFELTILPLIKWKYAYNWEKLVTDIIQSFNEFGPNLHRELSFLCSTMEQLMRKRMIELLTSKEVNVSFSHLHETKEWAFTKWRESRKKCMSLVKGPEHTIHNQLTAISHYYFLHRTMIAAALFGSAIALKAKIHMFQQITRCDYFNFTATQPFKRFCQLLTVFVHNFEAIHAAQCRNTLLDSHFGYYNPEQYSQLQFLRNECNIMGLLKHQHFRFDDFDALPAVTYHMNNTHYCYIRMS